jgi:PAS domain S-box-containing protein
MKEDAVRPDQAPSGTVSQGKGALDPSVAVWVADTADEAIFVTDLAGNLVYLNASARTHWGSTESDSGSKYVTQILAPDNVEAFVRAWDEILAGDDQEIPLDCRFRTDTKPDGVFQGVGSLARCRDSEGEFRYVRGKIQDITEIDRIKREVQEEKDLLDAIIQSVGVGLVIVDRTRNIFYQNETALRRYGLPSGRRCYSQFGLSESCTDCVLDQIKAGARKATCIQRGTAADGDELWVEILGTPVKDKSGQTIGIVEVIADITERKRMEAELLQASKLAAMGELVSGLAHEINNPLTIISGNVQLFLGRAAGMTENRPDLQKLLNEHLKTVLDETERAARIVRNLMTFARKSPAEKRMMDLNDAIRKTLELRSYELSVDGVETRLELDANLPRVNAGFNQIQQVLFNLLNNAAAALKEAEAEKIITIRSWSTEDQVKVSVSDTGPGIPEAHRGRVFDPFFSTKEVGKGTGLGLSICHGILESHGGSIWLEPTEGKGATFVFAFPFRTEDRAGKGAEGEKTGPTPLETRQKVLVVDDERDVLYVLEEGLRSEKLLVYPALGGEEALSQMEKREFNLILADIKMPQMDGREFYRRVREKNPQLARKIIFITGDVLSASTREFIDETGNVCVMKPFSLEKLREVVLQTIQERGSASGNEGEDI